MSEAIISLCNVAFTENIFKTGKKLSGKLNLSFNKSIVVSAVIARLYGVSEVKWNKATNSNITYKGHEMFLNLSQHILGQKKDVKLDRGDYEYYFEFDIPNILPSTFERDFGRIYYILEIKINSKKSKLYRIFNFPVKIERQEDIFNNQILMKEFRSERILIEGLKFDLFLPRIGYLINEHISVILKFSGQNFSCVQSVNLIFQTFIQLTSDPPRRMCREIQEIISVCNPILNDSNEEYKINVLFFIPQEIPTEISSLKNIKLFNQILVKLKVNDFSNLKEISIEIPIKISRNGETSSFNTLPSYEEALLMENTNF